MSTNTRTRKLPPAGWGMTAWGRLTWTHHGPSWGFRPPEREGWKCTFIARYGTEYTVYSYRPVVEVAS